MLSRTGNRTRRSGFFIVDSDLSIAIFLGLHVKRKTENEVVRKICVSLPRDAVQFLESRGGTRSGTIAKMIAASAGYRAWIKEQTK